MTDVRMPDGTVVRNVPEGTTQAELLRRLGKAQPQADFAPGWTSRQSVGPSDMSPADFERMAMSQSAENVRIGDKEIPWNVRNSAQEQMKVPLMGALGSLVTLPMGGWGGLLASSLAGGAGAATGEVIRQEQAGEPLDVKAAAKEGGKSAAVGFGVGAALKGLGAAAKAIFSTPLDDQAKSALSFARENDAPFPLASAVPGSGASRVQQGTRALLPGEIRTQVDANRVTQFLNNKVSTIVDNAKPVDEAALKGQQYLRQAFEPGETIYTQTFQNLRSTLGDETAVPLRETRKVMESVAEALKQRGEMKAVFNRIRNILKAAPEEQTVAQLDELYSGILKDTARNANARREANAVLSAIGRDIDDAAETMGFGRQFVDDIAKAKAVRDSFRELRNIPQLERLSLPFGEKGGTLGSRQWMTEMFSNPNGKALAELRSRNPDLYHELADSWVASNINRFSKPMDGGIGRALDGPAFRSWFEQNQNALKVVLGGPQTTALDNFSIYAKHMAGAVERGASGGGRMADPLVMMARGGGELASMAKAPFVIVPGEAASYVLAKGLSDPSSQLFKVFTEGFSPATRSFVIKSSQLAGQTAANAKPDER
jgi:uncharacterized protein (UPF0147 family)